MRRVWKHRWVVVTLAVAFVAATGIGGYRVYSRYHQEVLDQSMIQAIVDGKERRALSLLDDGADPNAVERPLNRMASLADFLKVLRGQRAAQNGPSALALAVRNGRERVGLRLLERGAIDVHARPEGNALLGWAVLSKQSHVALALLAHGAIEVNDAVATVEGPHLPLYLAVEHRAEALATALFEHGAHVSAPGDYALSEAVRGRLWTLVFRILDSATSHAVEADEMVAVAEAVNQGDIRMVRKLIKHGAKVTPADDYTELDTPLMRAAECERLDMLKLLLRCGARIDAGGRFGTALTHAAVTKRWKAVRFLVEHGARVDAADYHNYAALDVACAAGEFWTVTLLLEHGAKANKINRWGWAPILSACGGGSVPIIRMLLDRGVDVNFVDGREHRTPLLVAAKEGHVQAVKFLLSRGANPNVRLLPDGNDGVPYASALQLARKKGHTAVVSALLRAGAKQ